MYNCKVGFKVRELVTLRRLRPLPEEGTLVQVRRDGGDVEGRIMAKVLWKMTNLNKYPDYEAK